MFKYTTTRMIMLGREIFLALLLKVKEIRALLFKYPTRHKISFIVRTIHEEFMTPNVLTTNKEKYVLNILLISQNLVITHETNENISFYSISVQGKIIYNEINTDFSRNVKLKAKAF